MMQFNQHLDIKIEKKRSRFLATSAAFPDCKGWGETAEMAVDKLSGSIGTFISKHVKSSVKDLLTSDRYTEILFDHRQDGLVQRRVYESSTHSPVKKTAWIQVESVDELGGDAIIMEHKDELIEALNQPQAIEQTAQTLASLIGNLANQSKDGFMLGFPFSIN